MLTREDHAGMFGSKSALKAGVIRDANVFAQKQGKIAIPISAKEHPMGILADWASFELTFKVVDENDPEAKSGDIWSNYGIEGAQGWRNLGGQAVVYHAPVPASDGNAAHKAVNFSSLKVVSYQYDSRTDKGSLSVNISDYGLEARDWVIKNIGKICSSKEVLLEAGPEKSTGGHYRVLNESLKDGVLTIDFTAGFDSH